MAGERGEVDNRSSLGDPVEQGLGERAQSEQVDGDHGARRCGAGDAGDVGQAVDRTRDPVRDPTDGREVGEIAEDRHDALGDIGPAVDAEDLTPLGDESGRERGPDAGRRPGDHDPSHSGPPLGNAPVRGG